MPPNKPKNISIKVELANAGEFVIVRNMNTGQFITQALGGADKSTIVNPSPDFEWEEGDLIQAEIQGRLKGSKQARIVGGGAVIMLSNASVDTATPGLTL